MEYALDSEGQIIAISFNDTRKCNFLSNIFGAEAVEFARKKRKIDPEQEIDNTATTDHAIWISRR